MTALATRPPREDDNDTFAAVFAAVRQARRFDLDSGVRFSDSPRHCRDMAVHFPAGFPLTLGRCRAELARSLIDLRWRVDRCTAPAVWMVEWGVRGRPHASLSTGYYCDAHLPAWVRRWVSRTRCHSAERRRQGALA
jgi:hypothetical protein